VNIPEKIKIGFKDYEIKKIDGNIVDDNKVCYGRILYNDCKIEISTKYNKSIQDCTLLHETLHGIDDVFNIGIPEEHIVQLAKGLLQVIKDNPGIFKED
jgi:hypothetical protein